MENTSTLVAIMHTIWKTVWKYFISTEGNFLGNFHIIFRKAYGSTKGSLLYNMDLGHRNYPPDAKHYVVCVDENGKTGATPIGIASYKHNETTKGLRNNKL